MWWRNPLVLTTLLHAAAFPAATSVTWLYGATVVASTTASVVWHGLGEPRGAVSGIDHGLAAVWGLLDAYYGWRVGVLAPVLMVNAVVIALHSAVERGLVPYRAGHSAWHVVSAAKAWWVARALAAAAAA